METLVDLSGQPALGMVKNEEVTTSNPQRFERSILAALRQKVRRETAVCFTKKPARRALSAAGGVPARPSIDCQCFFLPRPTCRRHLPRVPWLKRFAAPESLGNLVFSLLTSLKRRKGGFVRA